MLKIYSYYRYIFLFYSSARRLMKWKGFEQSTWNFIQNEFFPDSDSLSLVADKIDIIC